MMVVVPSLSTSQQGDQQVIARVVTGCEATPAPQMRDRIDHPGDVQTERHRQKCTPENPGPSSDRKEGETHHGERDPVKSVEPAIKRLSREFRSVLWQHFCLVAQRGAR